MATTTKFYADLIQIVNPSAPTQSGTAEQIGYTSGSVADNRHALIHFAFPNELRFRKITEFKVCLFASPKGYAPFRGYLYRLKAGFDNTVTFATKPDSIGARELYGYSDARYIEPNELSHMQPIVDYGVEVTATTGALSTSLTNNPPYIEVTYSDEDDFGYVSGNPSSGYIPKAGQTTFRWSWTPPSDILGTLSVSSCRFAYRKGTTGNYTFVNCGSDLSYTSTAGMFSDTDTVQWYPEVTLSNGSVLVPTNISGVAYAYTLSTVEPALSAQGISPSGTIEDGSAPIEFTWSAWNSVGSPPSGANLQYSTDDGSTWTDMGSVSGSAKTYTAAANTLPGGELSWRVRAINGENVAGSWSSALTFINVAAPAVPSVSSDAAPFATITWDAVGQQAYEVTVDGVSYGVHFGTEKTFTLPQPLTDGNHTAQVRVQGQYSLWSQPGSVIFTVANVPDGTLDLTSDFGADAQLLWNATSAETDFLIYRDGVQIGHTSANEFTDRRAVGDHAWYVLLRLTSGNYTKSNVVTGELTVDAPMIAPLAGGPWISLRLTDSSLAQQQFKYSKTYTLRHFSGSPLPVLELTPYEDYSGTLQCAFPSDAEARPFEALRGQVVILKTRETVLIGGLMNLSKIRNPLYVAYQFTIEQIAVEEIVDDPGS